MLNNKALQVPYGTRDVLPGEAGARRIIENKLASTFKAWGYDEVVTPTFEYLDTFAAAGQLSDSSFKFFDRRNNILLLRSDMTTPLARLVATRLNEGPAVKRLFYLANLFRYEETQAGRQCEFNQAGVEMIENKFTPGLWCKLFLLTSYLHIILYQQAFVNCFLLIFITFLWEFSTVFLSDCPQFLLPSPV